MSVDVRCGDAMSVLTTLPAESVHCCVTSPPYFSLRDYNHPGQIGLESTPEEYISRLVDVFREVRRVLHPSGTLWVVMGDSYAGSGKGRMADGTHSPEHGSKQGTNTGTLLGVFEQTRATNGLKPKDLIGIPWMLAFALRADGWYLRSDIIWAKKAPMPESVTDRPTKAHEYVFLLSKSQTYFYDAAAVAEPTSVETDWKDSGRYVPMRKAAGDSSLGRRGEVGSSELRSFRSHRNKRSVWWLGPESYDGAHFAVFPTALVEPCILAGTSEYGCCPACLAPYERVVERGELINRGQSTGKNHHLVPPTAVRDGKSRFGDVVGKRLLNWQSTCRCNAGAPIPCTVLDIFAGSGTVGQVAVKHRRNALLIELNPSYVSLIDKRLNGVQQTLPLDGEAS